ncbi:hypothetical protein Mgra_00003459 [Meloidogyne graminicola]|uniref:Uncharacterized protein n=1 Tax=Meloidogyne graminicola TaxID=189291 RepID=A0A8S9ZV31_9BILA|nr:hypothetical protein Mgra_00003459 [Meloidogyne graminicola]
METTIISNNFPKEQQKQLNYPCKVRFQSLHSNNINGIIAQPLPKIDSLPQTRWRRFGSLKLISNKNKEQNQQQIRPLAAMSAIALRQQQSVRRLLTTTEEEDEDDDDDDDDEDETSSNSVPLNNTKTASNGFDGRKNLMQGERGKEGKLKLNFYAVIKIQDYKLFM